MSPTKNQQKKISPLTKWLSAAMSAFMLAYGIFIIVTQHYYGRTNKYGGAEVSADGWQAIIMAVAIIMIGLTPICLWMKSGRAAGYWAGTCMIIGILLFLVPAYIPVK
jgi:magnesium-transporting ATPase (P-type)